MTIFPEYFQVIQKVAEMLSLELFCALFSYNLEMKLGSIQLILGVNLYVKFTLNFHAEAQRFYSFLGRGGALQISIGISRLAHYEYEASRYIGYLF